MTLYFVRHGESEANLLREFSNRGLKHGLTAKGRQQAQALAASLRDVPVTALFCSPLLRARQTAEILAQQLGVAPEVADALREFDCGVLEGRSDAASWQAYAELSEAWLVRGEWDRRLEQGESFHELRQRFVPFVDQLKHHAGAVVLVGHGGTYRCMLPLILQNIDFKFSAAHALSHTALVVAEPLADGWWCRRWAGIDLGQPVTLEPAGGHDG